MSYRGTEWFQGRREVSRRRVCLECRQGMMQLPSLCLVCLLVISACLLPSASLAADTLGRLFFTPQDRVYLEKLRWASPESPSPLQEQQEKPAVAEDKPQVFSLEGTVTRKKGVESLWLNNIHYDGTDLPKNVRVQPPFVAGQILLHVPETGKSYALRPGQSVDINDGQIKEAYQRTPVTPATGSKTGPASAPSAEAPPLTVHAPEAPPMKP